MGGREYRRLTTEVPRRSGTASSALRVKVALTVLGAVTPWVLLLLLVLVVIAPPALPVSACGGSGALELNASGIPTRLLPIYEHAAARYGLGVRGPAVLAAINRIETDFGRNLSTSSAGAIGWMQFMPATWRAYGVDGNGDGRRDPANPTDAIFAAANYLHSSGAPRDWYRAVFAYNHADWYVRQVLAWARGYGDATPSGGASRSSSAPVVVDPAGACGVSVETSIAGVRRVCGGGRFVPIPGFPSERIDVRLLPDIAFIRAHYRIAITASYALSGHAQNGEHPIGLAIDIVPRAGGSWADIDRLARWAEPRQDTPRPPFRWVGYNGDANHGRGNHLHLSWSHSEPHTPGHPAHCVTTLRLARP